MADTYQKLQSFHPCFGGNRNNTGRIHLPVSPGCNISCKFCDRKINDHEDRPGVTSQVLTPLEAMEVLEKALTLCPEITVAGIAGPGDTLATNYALETFRLIREKYPRLIKCMSTNGLLLSERAEEIIEAGVDSLTVTVNGVDPEIEAKLNRLIVYHGKVYIGVEAASILIENQLKGIEKIAAAGITVKVNTVLVPGINGEHIEDIARAVKERGAQIYNLIPLIPQSDLRNEQAPVCSQIEEARALAGKHIDVFRHCQHCRADAVGLLGGKDYGDLIYQRRIVGSDTFSHG